MPVAWEITEVPGGNLWRAVNTLMRTCQAPGSVVLKQCARQAVAVYCFSSFSPHSWIWRGQKQWSAIWEKGGMEAQDRERERSDEPSQFSCMLKSSARKRRFLSLKQVPSFDFTWNWTLNYWIAVVFSTLCLVINTDDLKGMVYHKEGRKTEGNRGSQFLFYREWNQEILPHINGLKNRWLNMKFHL